MSGVGAYSFVAAPQTMVLPPLRQELNLFPGMPTLDGAPTWVLQDPVAHRFFQIGRREFEILSRWQLGTADAVVAACPRSALLDISEADIEELLLFLATHNLLQVRGPKAIARLVEQQRALTRRDWLWLLKSYLFLSFPLLNPNDWLRRMLPYMRWLGSATFRWVTLCVALAGCYLISRQWSSFIASFPWFFTAEGAATLAVSLALVKVLHELGHAFTARHFGCNVPSMGIALLVMWPVLYTDASDAWRLTSRRQRLLVSAAGMLVELGLAAYATLLWSFLGDGLLRSVMFVLATTTWLTTLLVNLNPFMRFDGYYLLTDLLGVPNLQARAFALGRWQLRQWLFGLEQAAPEHFPERSRKLLLLYSYGIWIYRFFLFLGIALLVYHFFFKLLGIFLMLVEIIWFIAMPIWTELKAWHKLRAELQWNSATRRTGLIVGIAALVLLFPWRWDVSAPATWRVEQHATLFGRAAGRVASIDVAVGEAVKAGQPLITLAAPDLVHDIAQSNIRIATLQRQLEAQGLDRRLQERARVLQQQLQTELVQQKGLQQELDSLQLVSPFDGMVKEILDPLQVGDWLPANQALVTVTGTSGSVAEAWVSETSLRRLTVGDRGWFYPDDIHRPPLSLTVTAIDPASTPQLNEAYLASTAGGALPVRRDADGTLVPVQPVYRVMAQVEAEVMPDQILPGMVQLAGARESLAGRAWRAAAAVLIRESGF